MDGSKSQLWPNEHQISTQFWRKILCQQSLGWTLSCKSHIDWTASTGLAGWGKPGLSNHSWPVKISCLASGLSPFYQSFYFCRRSNRRSAQGRSSWAGVVWPISLHLLITGKQTVWVTELLKIIYKWLLCCFVCTKLAGFAIQNHSYELIIFDSKLVCKCKTCSITHYIRTKWPFLRFCLVLM